MKPRPHWYTRIPLAFSAALAVYESATPTAVLEHRKLFAFLSAATMFIAVLFPGKHEPRGPQ